MKSPIENHIVDLLLPADERRLTDALSASKPLPASDFEECAGYLKRQRKNVSVQSHQQWRESLAPPTQEVEDLLDSMIEADPYEVHFGPTQTRKQKEANRLLAILDEIGKEGRA